MDLIFRSIRNKVNPVNFKHSTQFQQIRTKFADWRMAKDYRKRQTVKQFGEERLRINMLRKNSVLPREIREIADKDIAAFPRDAATNRIVHRCVITSRPRGVVKEFRLSRIMFRHLADYNQLSGIQRAMW